MRNTYDYRIKQEVALARDPKIFQDLGVNPSTARNWIYRGTGQKTICKEITNSSLINNELRNLRKEVARLKAILSLQESVNKVFPISLNKRHVSSPIQRSLILESIEQVKSVVGLSTCLSSLGISMSRYKRWRSTKNKCPTSNSPSCHRKQPNQLTATEINTMKKIYCSKKYMHMSVRSLQLYAQRNMNLNCCADTWYKYAKLLSWERPKNQIKKTQKKSPVKKADKPGEIIHIDISYIKTTSGTTYYLQTILDNSSRYVLGWNLSSNILGENTAKNLKTSFETLKKLVPYPNKINLVSDGGSENINEYVKEHIKNKENTTIKHRIAKHHIRFSNNMIECWFRSLKQNYLNKLPAKNKKELERRIKFFIDQHNNFVPQAVLMGATPYEKITGTWIPKTESEKREIKTSTRLLRVQENKKLVCGGCSLMA